MGKSKLGAVKLNYGPKEGNASETALWEALETMFSQGLISTIVPSFINLSKAVVSRQRYLHRHAVCNLRSGDKVTLVLATSENGWHAPGGVIEYADGRKLNLESVWPIGMPKMVWVTSLAGSSIDLWAL